MDILMKKLIKVGSQFSGVGAFEQSLIRLGIDFKNIYAADWDRYARQTYLLNFEEPEYYIKDVHDTPIQELTEKHGSLDIAMFSPPCQAFSMAGKRLGKEDQRGILFFNSLEFIKENNPRYFIFENVKGLLSHDKVDKKAEFGRTFQEWINYLGGKSVNGVHTFLPYEDSVPYHIYFQVLNAKNYGIPQNRERIFIIGIRDDEDNDFTFPKPIPLTKRLKDVLEPEVDEKYFLSEKMFDYLTTRKDNFNNGNINFKDENSVASTITKSSSSLDISDNIIRLGNVNPSGNGMNGNVFSENGISPTLSTNKGEGIKIGTWLTHEDGKGFREMEDELCPTIPVRAREDGSGQPVIKISSNFGNKRLEETLNTKSIPEEDCIIDSYNKSFHTEVSPCISTRVNASSCTHVKTSVKSGRIVGRNPENPKSRKSGLETEQMLEINENGTSNALTTVQKDNVVLNQQRIRRLTPLEAFRLMDFNFGIPGVKDFVWNVSDSQAYKQAGNSICVGVLAAIIERLKLD